MLAVGPWRGSCFDARVTRLALILLLCVFAPGVARAQDTEPRRWTHLPAGTNVTGLTYIYTAGDVGFDPVMDVQDATVRSHTLLASYVRSFDFFGTTARVDALLPVRQSRWEGMLSGMPASRTVSGLADPWVRFSVNLLGAPALRGKEYLEFRAANRVHTIIGAAVGVGLPLGDYEADKLLNLGENRFTIRPQAGVVHMRGPWSFELTSSAFFFTANDDFFGGNERTQDPVYAVQGHVIHTFANRWWVSLSAAYGGGGESQVNGVGLNDERANILGALSFGLPVGDSMGLKFVYLRSDTQKQVGVDTNSLFASWTIRF